MPRKGLSKYPQIRFCQRCGAEITIYRKLNPKYCRECMKKNLEEIAKGESYGFHIWIKGIEKYIKKAIGDEKTKLSSGG